MAEATATTPAEAGQFSLPRVTIQFCTQCKWMLRAAYFAQELLSTFSTSLGEVALQPGTGGVFVVRIVHANPDSTSDLTTLSRTLWDRKVDGGFPETKELKRRVRDVIDPARDLGHVDRDHAKKVPPPSDAHASGDGVPQIPGSAGVSSLAEQLHLPPFSELAARVPVRLPHGSGTAVPPISKLEGDQESTPMVEDQLDEATRQRAQKTSGAGDAGGYPGGTEAAASVAHDEAVKGHRGGEQCEDCD